MNLNIKPFCCRSLLSGVFLFILFIAYSQTKIAMAEAWLVGEGEHKYSYSHLGINKKSKKLLRENEKYLDDIYRREYALFQQRRNIFLAYKNRFGKLPNSKRVLVEEIDKELKDLNELKNVFSPFNTYQEDRVSIVYGINNRHNIGIDAIYSDNVRNVSRYRSKAAEVHHKNAIYQGENFIISLKSAISYNNYYHNKSKATLKESLFWGLSTKNKYFGDGFLEIGLHGRTGLDHSTIGQHSIGFSSSQGTKIFGGLILSNYSQVDYYQHNIQNDRKPRVDREFFDQFSIAKEMNFANILGVKTPKHNNNITIQLGYFWKVVMSQSSSIVSGPTLSVWFAI